MIYDKYNYTIPKGMSIRVITNTDAKNEADDQYAIVHTLLSPRFDNRGVIAAHFGDKKTKTSMEDSYDEVIKVLDLMKFDRSLAFEGAPHKIPDEKTPVPSPGAELIIKEAMADDDRPLFVTFLGPLTDLASSYLMEPKIADRLTAIWIGGGTYPNGGMEYNLSNDIDAANVVFKSNIPVWQVPLNVYQLVLVSMTELEYRVRPCGELGKYLFEQLVEWGHTDWARKPPRTGECWCLGDSPVVGLMLFDHPHSYDWVPAPEFTKEMSYIHSEKNRPIRVYKYIDTRFIMEDFYAKLAMFTKMKIDR
jgi:purine nucleosidase